MGPLTSGRSSIEDLETGPEDLETGSDGPNDGPGSKERKVYPKDKWPEEPAFLFNTVADIVRVPRIPDRWQQPPSETKRGPTTKAAPRHLSRESSPTGSEHPPQLQASSYNAPGKSAVGQHSLRAQPKPSAPYPSNLPEQPLSVPRDDSERPADPSAAAPVAPPPNTTQPTASGFKARLKKAVKIKKSLRDLRYKK